MLLHIKYAIIGICLLMICGSASAGIPMSPLKYELTAAAPVYEQGAVIEFKLRITNRDNETTYPVLLPLPGYSGKRFIYLTAYQMDEHGTLNEVARPMDVGIADTTSSMYIRHLKPGEYVDISLKLYDGPRFAVLPSEPQWFNNALAPGSYYFQALYQPSGAQGLDGRSDVAFYGVLNGSDYCRLEIKAREVSRPYRKLEQCGTNCSFCRAIEHKRWNKVERTIEAELKNAYTRMDKADTSIASRGHWLDQHRNVVYISPPPEAILAIFPARWSRTISFKSHDTVHHYGMTIQLGKTYRTRTQLQSLVNCIFPRLKLFRTTDEDHVGISQFKPIQSVGFYL